jgi:hypothetical protein
MGNDVVSTATRNFFEKYGEAATGRGLIGDLLLFNKYGEYVHGRDRLQLRKGTALAGYMKTLHVGYVEWEGGQIVNRWMGLVCEGFVPPKRSELGHTDPSQWGRFDDGQQKDPIQFSNELVLVNLETEAFYTFSTSSKGGLGAIGELSKDYGKHIRQNPDDAPLIELDVGSYRHPDYGEIRFPIFKRNGWIPTSKLPPLPGGEPEPEEQPALALPEKSPLPDPEPARPAAAKPATPKAKVRGF